MKIKDLPILLKEFDRLFDDGDSVTKDSLTIDEIKSWLSQKVTEMIVEGLGEMEDETYEKAHTEAWNYGIKTHKNRKTIIRNQFRREILEKLKIINSN